MSEWERRQWVGESLMSRRGIEGVASEGQRSTAPSGPLHRLIHHNKMWGSESRAR